jgi:hypothetical protein
MRTFQLLALGTFLVLAVSPSFAKEVSGEYIEARTCDVYTGPCFANGEVGISSVKGWTPRIVGRKLAAISLKSDHLAGVGEFEVKDLVRLQTRQLSRRDCVCSNESVIYPPLASVENSQAVFTRRVSYTGNAGGGQWNSINRRSAFLATFEK